MLEKIKSGLIKFAKRGDKLERLSYVLKDVKPENCFWINNSVSVRNVYELVSALQNMEENTFNYHVNQGKNDFSVWVNDILMDTKLAKDLLKTRDRGETINKIKDRIDYIEGKLDRKGKRQIIEIKKEALLKELKVERALRELIISFILGIILGIAIGILLEHYSIIPRGWF